MAKRPLPDAETLRKLLIYDAETGKLFWRHRTPDLFQERTPEARQSRANAWNRLHAGREALSRLDAHGYFRGRIMGHSLLAHRVIWKIQTGQQPFSIDHIDGNRANNSFANLRAVDARENARNRKREARNRTGLNGVHYRPDRGLWRARIKVDGRDICLGHFTTKQAAHAARLAANERFAFHPNHGRNA